MKPTDLPLSPELYEIVADPKWRWGTQKWLVGSPQTKDERFQLRRAIEEHEHTTQS